MDRKIIDSYSYLLKLVNREISCCLGAIDNIKNEAYLNDSIWGKEILRNEKFKLKELKEIKLFLINEIRFEKMIENVVDKLEAEYEKNI